MSSIPAANIQESLKLSADAEIDLFQLTPTDGSGTLFFKADAPLTWAGQLYVGLPLLLSGEKLSSDQSVEQPKLTIGQPNLDLSVFKPLIYDGALDNAVILRLRGLLGNFLAGLNIVETKTFRVKRIDSYQRTRIEMTLAPVSDALDFTLPIRQYLPPDFQAVYYGT